MKITFLLNLFLLWNFIMNEKCFSTHFIASELDIMFQMQILLFQLNFYAASNVFTFHLWFYVIL